MRARRAGLGISLVVLAVWGSRWAAAQGSLNTAITPVYQSEGRDPVSFFVACATAPWTAVVSSDTIRRSLTMVAISSNTNTICLSPGTSAPAASVRCSSTTVGPELSPSSSLTDYSRAAWWCASSSNTVVNGLKGYYTRDRSDWGAVGSNRGN